MFEAPWAALDAFSAPTCCRLVQRPCACGSASTTSSFRAVGRRASRSQSPAVGPRPRGGRRRARACKRDRGRRDAVHVVRFRPIPPVGSRGLRVATRARRSDSTGPVRRKRCPRGRTGIASSQSRAVVSRSSECRSAVRSRDALQWRDGRAHGVASGSPPARSSGRDDHLAARRRSRCALRGCG